MKKHNIKAIYVYDKLGYKGPYVTTKQAEIIAKNIIENEKLPCELGNYSDGKRHIGTECSRIYKSLLPVRGLASSELLYLRATTSIRASLEECNIPNTLKPLRHKTARGEQYVQLVSVNLLRIYLGGKLELRDEIVCKYTDSVYVSQADQNVVIIKCRPVDCVLGNKPVDIQGKPLVRVLQQLEVDDELKKMGTPPRESLESNLFVGIDSKDALTYVKTGPLMRKDIYVTLKSIAAKEQKPFYQVVESMLLGTCQYTLKSLDLGDEA